VRYLEGQTTVETSLTWSDATKQVHHFQWHHAWTHAHKNEILRLCLKSLMNVESTPKC